MVWKKLNPQDLATNGLLLLLMLFVYSSSAFAEIKTITLLPYTVYSEDNYDTLRLASRACQRPEELSLLPMMFMMWIL